MKNKKKQIGAIQVAPSFTVDRFFVYLVGGAATLAGLYVISIFVRRGLDDKTSDKPLLTNKSDTANVSFAPSNTNGYQEGLSIDEMKRVQNFLMQKGYNLGNSIATGIAGPKTFQAVRSAGYNSARDLLNNI